MLFLIKKITDFKTLGLDALQEQICHWFFFFFGCTTQPVGSLFPEQGWKTGLLKEVQSPTHWTTREVPLVL